MIIKELRLHNFGIYKGTAVFDLKPQDQKPVIVIEGKNGSGKTTLLSALQLALYGPAALGLKQLNQNYIERVSGLINLYSNNQEKKAPDSYVQISFDLFIDNHRHEIELTRSWFAHSVSNFKEVIEIWRDDVKLTPQEQSDFESYLRKRIPPNVLDFFMFDGEQIQKLLHANYHNNIREAFFSLFNYGLVETLIADINNYLKQDNIFQALSEEQKEYMKQKINCLEKQELINHLKSDQEENAEKLLDLDALLDDLEKEFQAHGGLFFEQREEQKNKIRQMEKQKLEAHDQLKEYVGKLLPFVLCKSLLAQTLEQAERESENAITSQVLEKLEAKMNEAYKDITSKKNIKVLKNDKPSKVNLISELMASLKEETIAMDDIHDLNKKELGKLRQATDQVESFDLSLVSSLLKNIAAYNKNILKAKQKLALQDKNSSFTDLLEQINQTQKKIHAIRTELENNKTLIDEEETKLEEVQARLEQSRLRYEQAQKDEDSFAICDSVITTLEQFLAHSLKSRISVFRKNLLEVIHQLYRKHLLVSDVLIDPASFQVSLVAADNTVITHDKLSAGEKQLYILSLLWALIQTAQDQYPLVFDSLLGRLDSSHTQSIVSNYLPNISKQVLVLCTDTEISAQNKQHLLPHVSHYYHLEYRETEKTVQITKTS